MQSNVPVDKQLVCSLFVDQTLMIIIMLIVIIINWSSTVAS